MTKKYIIVGGLPSPIGGVTTFLRRMMHWDADQIDLFIDFYPGEKHDLPKEASDKTVFLHSKWSMFFWIFWHAKRTRNRFVLFNFSTARALLALALLRKPATAKWKLILHHGTMATSGAIFTRLARRALAKMDFIYALSDHQVQFFLSMGVSPAKIQKAISYYPPVPIDDNPTALASLSAIRASHSTVLVMSGYPTDIYNFQIAIDQVVSGARPRTSLVIFLYGQGDLREPIVALGRAHADITVFEDMPESFFNTFLKNADGLLRLNKVDSFGIAVADAVSFGVPVVATDVCQRYLGARLINLAALQKKPELLLDTLFSKDPIAASVSQQVSQFSLGSTE